LIHITAGSRLIGPGQPCLIVAEIGVNHNGDPELAHRLIDAARAAGADAVKFQNYRTADFISNAELTYSYASGGQSRTESQLAMFERYEFGDDRFIEMKRHCDDAGVMFFSTPTSLEGIEFLERLGVPLLKNGSDFLTHVDLIAAMARSSIPTILSTGMATEGEIDDAVAAFRAAGGTDLALLHCTSTYPAPVSELNLARIPTLAHKYGCPAGFSDHSHGALAALGAVALGACMVEKHFTLDRTMEGPDHWFSSDPEELKVLVSAVRNIEQAIGSPALGPAPSEQRGREQFRLSCVAAAPLRAGHALTLGDIVIRRPGTGIPPKHRDGLIGRTLRRDVAAGSPLVWEDVDG
jgi:N,N'-diacetyllegionaminate synthase